MRGPPADLDGFRANFPGAGPLRRDVRGLRSHEHVRRDIWKRSDWHGRQHDSRSGLAAFYRYRPRDVEDLSRECGIDKPKVHRGVR